MVEHMLFSGGITGPLKWLLFCLFLCLPSLAQVLPSTASLSLKGIQWMQNISNGYLDDFSGNRYELAELSPFNSLISEELDPQSNDESTMPIHRTDYIDGTSLLVEKDASGEILHALLRRDAKTPTLYFVKTLECEKNEVVVFSENQVDDTDFDGLPFGDENVLTEALVPSSSMESEYMMPNSVANMATRRERAIES